jgi:hypothetical protein
VRSPALAPVCRWLKARATMVAAYEELRGRAQAAVAFPTTGLNSTAVGFRPSVQNLPRTPGPQPGLAESDRRPDGSEKRSQSGYLAENAPKTGLISLRAAENRLYSAPSHTETWLTRPSGGNRANRLVIAHTFPEEPTGEPFYGAT